LLKKASKNNVKQPVKKYARSLSEPSVNACILTTELIHPADQTKLPSNDTKFSTSDVLNENEVVDVGFKAKASKQIHMVRVKSSSFRVGKPKTKANDCAFKRSKTLTGHHSFSSGSGSSANYSWSFSSTNTGKDCFKSKLVFKNLNKIKKKYKRIINKKLFAIISNELLKRQKFTF
jgi:hypothetical protein